jgi:hypothetical protein
MAVTLPDINALGRRPTPQGGRSFAQQDTTAVGAALSEEAGKLYEQERRDKDAQDVLAARRQLDEWERTARDQAQARKGKDAFEVPETLARGFDEASAKVAGQITSRRALQAFQEMAAVRRASVLDWGSNYATRERQAYNVGEYNANVAGFQRNAADDPERAAGELMLMQSTIERFGRAEGISEKEIALRVAANTDALHAGVVRSYLIAKDPAKAAAYFDKVKDSLGVATRGSLNEAVSKVANAIEVNDYVTRLNAEMGPRSPNDPFLLKDMDAAARKHYATEPEKLQSVLSSLAQMASVHDYQQRETNATLTNAVVGAYDNDGKRKLTVAQVRALPAFMAMPATEQSKIIKHIDDENYSSVVRATASEARAEQLIRIREAQRERETNIAYNALSDVDTLSAMSVAQVAALLPVLGQRRTEHLISFRQQLESREAKLTAKVDQDTMKALLSAAGLPAYRSGNDLSEEQKARLGNMRAALNEGLTALQKRKNGLATDEEKKVELQRIIDDKVMREVSFAADKSEPAAALTDKDKQTAYVVVGGREVKLSEIPRTDEEQIRAELRRLGAAETWQNIAELYVAANRSKQPRPSKQAPAVRSPAGPAPL